MPFHVPERFRVTREMRYRKWWTHATDATDGNNGLFFVCLHKGGPIFKVIASDGDGWEHVSISLPDRCPLWKEMCELKALFWDVEDAVMQLHPPQSQWVNVAPCCLHLWRPTEAAVPLPPQFMV